MKIKHNITRTGSTLHGHILETIFEEGEKRGDIEFHYTKDKKFLLSSVVMPEIGRNSLYVHGDKTSNDNDKVYYTYPTEQEAQQTLDYINEFSVTDEPKIEYVYVSDDSEEDALKNKYIKILLFNLPGKAVRPYLCVCGSDEDNYIRGEEYMITMWKYAVPVPTDEKKLRQLYLTDEEFDKLTTLLLK